MNVLLYALHKLESTILKCNSAADSLVYPRDSVHSWDKCVAFFVEDLEGIDGSSSGKVIYALVDKYCQNFVTFSALGDKTKGISQVNHQLFDMFNQEMKNSCMVNMTHLKQNYTTLKILCLFL